MGSRERHDSVVAELIYHLKQAGARWARSTVHLTTVALHYNYNAHTVLYISFYLYVRV